MKISDLIAELEYAKRRYGDLPVFTYDGPVTRFTADPSINGLNMIHAEGRPANEIVLEVRT